MTLKYEDREDLIRHHQRKARETVKQVELLLKNAQYTLAVNRIYYGVYYMLSAIALKEHFETSKHLQLIGWFNKTYVKTGLVEKEYGRWIRQAYENRMEGDYNVLADFPEEKVNESFEKMKEVIEGLEKLL